MASLQYTAEKVAVVQWHAGGRAKGQQPLYYSSIYYFYCFKFCSFQGGKFFWLRSTAESLGNVSEAGQPSPRFPLSLKTITSAIITIAGNNPRMEKLIGYQWRLSTFVLEKNGFPWQVGLSFLEADEADSSVTFVSGAK